MRDSSQLSVNTEFSLCSRQVEGCFFSETLGFQRAPEAVCLQFIVTSKKHFLKLKVPSCTFYDGAPGIMCKGSWELKHLWKALCTHQAAGAIPQLLPGLVTAWRITPARWSTCIFSLPQAGGREARWNAPRNAVRSPFASSSGKEDVSVDPHHITCKPPTLRRSLSRLHGALPELTWVKSAFSPPHTSGDESPLGFL